MKVSNNDRYIEYLNSLGGEDFFLSPNSHIQFRSMLNPPSLSLSPSAVCRRISQIETGRITALILVIHFLSSRRGIVPLSTLYPIKFSTRAFNSFL